MGNSEAKRSGTARDIQSMSSASVEALAAYYDDWASSYDTELESMGYKAPVRAAELLEVHGVPASACILDACCGTGLTGRRLKDAGFRHVVGFDISVASLEKARSSKAYDRVFRQDMKEPLAEPDDAFDALQCVGALTYADDREALLREFARVVKPGGIVLITHRDDLWDDAFDAMLDRLARDGVLEQREKTDPQPYIPDHPDFADKVRLIYGVYRVGDAS